MKLDLAALNRGLSDAVVDAHYPDGITPLVAQRWTDEIIAEEFREALALGENIAAGNVYFRLHRLRQVLPDFRVPQGYREPEREKDIRGGVYLVAVRHEDGRVVLT